MYVVMYCAFVSCRHQQVQHQWCSGNINAFQAFALGSIPGWCSDHLLLTGTLTGISGDDISEIRSFTPLLHIILFLILLFYTGLTKMRADGTQD